VVLPHRFELQTYYSPYIYNSEETLTPANTDLKHIY